MNCDGCVNTTRHCFLFAACVLSLLSVNKAGIWEIVVGTICWARCFTIAGFLWCRAF